MMMGAKLNKADRDFLKAMIAHHEDALRLAREVITNGNDVTVDELAKKILRAQAKEIDEMRSMLE